MLSFKFGNTLFNKLFDFFVFGAAIVGRNVAQFIKNRN